MGKVKVALQGAAAGLAVVIVVVSIINTVGDAADFLSRHVSICGKPL